MCFFVFLNYKNVLLWKQNLFIAKLKVTNRRQWLFPRFLLHFYNIQQIVSHVFSKSSFMHTLTISHLQVSECYTNMCVATSHVINPEKSARKWDLIELLMGGFWREFCPLTFQELEDEELEESYAELESMYVQFLADSGLSTSGYWRGGAPVASDKD
jgi:hypothetical protein